MLLILLAYLPVAFVLVRAGPPTAILDKAIVIGTTNDSVTSFFGIPYAEPPYVARVHNHLTTAHQTNTV